MLFRKRNAGSRWEKLDPIKTGYWGKNEEYRQWLLGDLTILTPQKAFATVFRGDGAGGFCS